MAQLAKCLLCRYENLSTNPQQAHKKLGMMVGTSVTGKQGNRIWKLAEQLLQLNW